MLGKMSLYELVQFDFYNFSSDKQKAIVKFFGAYECYHKSPDGYYYCAGSTYEYETARKYLAGEDVELLT